MAVYADRQSNTLEQKGKFVSKMLFVRSINRLCRPFGVNPFPRAFESQLKEHNSSAQEIFDEIHRNNFWGSKESRSGVGSEYEFTKRYREDLSTLLQKHGLKSVFDAPCGDLNWMSVFLSENDIRYIGGDISEEVISEAVRHLPRLSLRVFDITKDEFPDADVWHCRDCLFHLPFSAIREALERYSESRIPFALVTSHRARLMHRNLDVGFGGFRFLDLERSPTNLPRPLDVIPDYTFGTDFPRYVCLWSRDQVSEALSRSY